MKTHLHHIVSGVKLTYKELTAVLAQVEARWNSRSLVALSPDDDGVEALTPGHFLIVWPLEALPDQPAANNYFRFAVDGISASAFLKHFWKCWSNEYLASLCKIYNWHQCSRNIAIADVVLVLEDGLVPSKGPLAHVTEVYPGIKTSFVLSRWKLPLELIPVLCWESCLFPFEHWTLHYFLVVSVPCLLWSLVTYTYPHSCTWRLNWSWPAEYLSFIMYSIHAIIIWLRVHMLSVWFFDENIFNP